MSQPAAPADEEVRRLFEENRARLVHAELVRARHLLLSVPPGADAEKEAEVETRIRELLQEIRAGADFA
jgi:parvulin-like peptidyl-prolyl isomerase